MAYEAIVARIHTRPHPKADRLQLGTVCGHQVVVGLDTKDGELGVFFPADGQLSDEFVRANELYSKSAMDKLGLLYTENHKFGFFSERRRVRAQSFRGEKTDGFWCPMDYFRWTHASKASVELLPEGYTFVELNGHAICNKYETPATKRAQSNLIGRRQRENKCFPKHDVTKRFHYVSDKIPADAVIYITEKLHGTSGRYGYVLDENPLPAWRLFLNRFLPRKWRVVPSREYRYLNGSKNVILEKSTGAGYYGTNDFRYRAIEGVTLKKGEVIYFELVGWVVANSCRAVHYSAADQAACTLCSKTTVRPIMDSQPIKEELKDVRKQYGEQMHYRYGQPEGTCDIYVYKIIHMNEDGEAIDLSWPQVKARCKELGLKHVPELLTVLNINMPNPAYDGLDPGTLESVVARLTEGPSTLDASHIREGVVLRVESEQGIEYIKNKSWTFGVLEGYLKSDDLYVDTEEAA